MNIKIIPVIVTLFIVAVETAISFNSVLLPNIKIFFDVSERLSQMTIALGLLTLGIAGIIYGGLSDSIGRRPILLFSTALFCISSFFCFYANSIEQFLVAKFFQGLGSGSGWVVGNACIKDLYDGKKYANIMNRIHAVTGIVPAVAPVLGSYLALFIGWRQCFLTLFFLSFLVFVFMFFYQQETLESKKTVCLKRILINYKNLFLCHDFCQYLFVKVMAVMLLFCEISNMPLIFIDHMGIDSKSYSFYVLPVFLMYVIANIVSSYLNKKTSIKKIIQLGLAMIVVSNTLLVILNGFMTLTPLIIQCIKIWTYIGWGFIFGNATAKIVSSVPGSASMAAAIMIAMEMIVSALGIYVLSLFSSGTVLPLTTLMIIAGSIGLLGSTNFFRLLLSKSVCKQPL